MVTWQESEATYQLDHLRCHCYFNEKREEEKFLIVNNRSDSLNTEIKKFLRPA